MYIYVCVYVCEYVLMYRGKIVENWGLFIKKRGDGDGWIFNKLV